MRGRARGRRPAAAARSRCRRSRDAWIARRVERRQPRTRSPTRRRPDGAWRAWRGSLAGSPRSTSDAWDNAPLPMLIVESYGVAVVLCVVTMLCWGSWANTQKLASRDWPFQLFYWDYAIGVVLFAFVLGHTAGNTGDAGRGLAADLHQAADGPAWSAFLGGVIFNLSNILLVAAIDIAGMAVAFPVGVGLALVLGVITNYVAAPVGNAALLFLGVGFVVAAILLSAVAYSRLP